MDTQPIDQIPSQGFVAPLTDYPTPTPAVEATAVERLEKVEQMALLMCEEQRLNNTLLRQLLEQGEQRQAQIMRLLDEMRHMRRELPRQVSQALRPMVREELLRSRLVTADGPTEEQLLNMLQRALRPWLTQAPDQRQRMEHHFLPLLGEQKVWMDGDRVCVHCNYLQKFVDALFACMDAYHYDALRTRRVQTSTDLRVFLEHVVSYRQGNAERPLHIMTPIIRACRKMRPRRILDVRE